MDTQYPDHQKELKELFETGVTQRQIDAAKQKQKEQADLLMKQAAEIKVPEKKKEPAKKFSKGGTASARADGIATKGKTKGRII